VRDRPVIVALLVTAGFMLARLGLKLAAGADASFLHVDALKTVPRLAAAGACWWAMGPRGPRAWGWSASARAGAVLAAATGLAHSARYLGQAVYGFTAAEIAFGAVLTVPLAVWEELCYRGLLFGGLRDSLGARRAALASTAVFTVMHWGSMDVSTWPSVFMTGFAFCGALELGAGLPFLIFVHWAVDAVWFLTGGDILGPFWLRISDIGMLAACAYAWEALRETPGAPPSPTRPE
jgi:membrane protease YdiL (CAAX protease family)